MARNPYYSPESWDECVSAWLEELEIFGRRPWTLAQYGGEMGRFSEWSTQRRLSPVEVEAHDIYAYVREVLVGERGLGGRSIAARLAAIRGFFEWMIRHQMRATNPGKAVPTPTFRKPNPKVLTVDQLATLLDLPLRRRDTWRTRRDAAVLRTLAWTGVRISEAVALDWDHLDLNRDAATMRIVDGKGGKDRSIPIVEPLVDSLIYYYTAIAPLGTHRALFQADHGRRFSVTGMRGMIQRYGERLGVHVHPHMLRAQCATQLFRTGANIAEVRAVLGHAGFDTLAAYSAVAAHEARDALAKAARSSASRPARYSSGNQQSEEVER